MTAHKRFVWRDVRFPSDERNLYRQLARRKAAKLGMTRSEWRRERRDAVSALAADILMVMTPITERAS